MAANIVEALNLVFNLRQNVADHFGVKNENVKFDSDEPDYYVITVTCFPSDLSHGYSNHDFDRFCNALNLSGVMFLNRDNTITFSMSPTVTKSKKMVKVDIVQDGRYIETKEMPYPSDLCRKLYQSDKLLSAVKLYREENQTKPFEIPILDAKCCIQQHGSDPVEV